MLLWGCRQMITRRSFLQAVAVSPIVGVAAVQETVVDLPMILPAPEMPTALEDLIIYNRKQVLENAGRGVWADHSADGVRYFSRIYDSNHRLLSETEIPHDVE